MNTRPKPQAWSALLALALLVAPATHAQVGLKIRLVPETTAIVPGQPFHVGVFIQHEPGYHTYWRQPGIVGVATSLHWDLPPGFVGGPLEYPAPEPTKMFQIKAQGYERDLLLQARIVPPATLPAGETVTLRGRAVWMCCARTCHPGNMEITLTLPVAEQSAPDPRWQPLFEKERRAFSQRSGIWTASAREVGDVVHLELKPAGPAARPFGDPGAAATVMFFTEDGWINSDAEQIATLAADGSLRMTLKVSEYFTGRAPPDRLLGIVNRPGGWHNDGGVSSMIIAPTLIRDGRRRLPAGS